MLDNDKHDLLDDHRKEHSWMKVHQNTRSSFRYEVIGNLRTTTKFTTTTSIDWERLERERQFPSVEVVDDEYTECKHKCKTVMFVPSQQSFSQ